MKEADISDTIWYYFTHIRINCTIGHLIKIKYNYAFNLQNVRLSNELFITIA